MSCKTPNEYKIVIEQNEVIDFCKRCMVKVGVSEGHSKALAEVLSAGDYRGHYSHGFNRLGTFPVTLMFNLYSNVCKGYSTWNLLSQRDPYD